MKKLILCFVILFAVDNIAAVSEVYAGPVSSRYSSSLAKTSENRSTFPNIFRKLKRGLRRMVGLPVYICILVNNPANVTGLSLSREEIIVNEGGEESSKIDIFTDHTDPEGDVVTFNYRVSAGKIIGVGAKVIWDLTNVGPGTYTIQVGVNDGMGICGETKTRRIEVLECAGCTLRETD